MLFAFLALVRMVGAPPTYWQAFKVSYLSFLWNIV